MRCDDGNASNDDGCTTECTLAECGDGIVRGGVEDCDDGNGDDLDACRNDCTVAACGDGVRRQDVAEGQVGYEACDDGNRVDTDSCLNSIASLVDAVMEFAVMISKLIIPI